MNAKNIIYLLIGFVLPVALFVSAIVFNIKNVWLPTLSLAWFLFDIILFISYKS